MATRIIPFLLALGISISAHATFLGTKLVIDPVLNSRARVALAAAGVPDANTAVVIRVYAEFDGLGDGQVNKVISTGFKNIVPAFAGISFYQDSSGGLTAPNSGLFPHFPTLEFDTFGTIGILDSINGDSTATDPDASMNQFSINGGWFNSNPTNLNGAAIDQGGFFGTLLFQITVIGPGVIGANHASSAVMGSGAIFELSPNGTALMHNFTSFTPPCVGELTGNLIVDSADLAVLLVQWGPAPTDSHGTPLFSPPADLNEDFKVDSGDLSILLTNWGCFP